MEAFNLLSVQRELMLVKVASEACNLFEKYTKNFAFTDWLKALIVMSPIRDSYEKLYYDRRGFQFKKWLGDTYDDDQRRTLEISLDQNTLKKLKVALFVWRSVGVDFD